MIRPMDPGDLSRVLDIWLAANLQAHDFLPAAYWRSNYEAVKQLLPSSDLYVFETGQQVDGFAGLLGHELAGLFVAPDRQSRGIGRALLLHCKGLYPALTLHAYQENRRAVEFYLRESFTISAYTKDENTGAAEYEMTWRRTAT